MEVKECLRLEDGDESYSCLLKAVKEAGGGPCPPRLVLLLEDEECEPCTQALAAYAGDIKKNLLEVVSTNSKDGKDIIEQNDIEYSPSILLLDCHNKIIE